MCGIFGYIGSKELDPKELDFLVRHSQIRGRDSSGLVVHRASGYVAAKADFAITRLCKKVSLSDRTVFFGHSRLITNGLRATTSLLCATGCT